ncbi:MAG: magnesium transporter [Candidatus Helarchaeota archaeon]
MKTRRRVKEITSYIRSSIVVLVLATIIEIIVGSLLGEIFYHSYFPGILILIPPMMELRGNISSAFAAKLSTALHLGIVKPQLRHNTKKYKDDFYATIIIIIIMPIILGSFVWIFCIIFNIPNIGLIFFILIALLTSILAGSVMTIITILISILTFKYGLNPDAIVVPILGFLGDILTIVILYIVIGFLEIIGLGVII